MNFIEQAYKGRNNWLYYFAAITLILFGWQLIGTLPLALVAILHSKNLGEFSNAANESFMTLGIDKNLFLFLMILMFAIGLFFLFVAIKFIHKRAFKTVVTSRENIDWSRFWFGFVTFGIIAVSVTLLGIFLSPENYTWSFKPVPFFTLVAVSFLFLPLQTSFEELLFRGYFMQGLGTWFKNRWMPLIITSVAFGLLHGANPEVEKLGYISMVFYIGTGFFFGITTLMDEGTELVLGVHAINNIVAAFLVTTNWTVFQTDALFVDTSEPSVGIEMFLPVFVLYPLILLLFSKKYGWKNWQEKLTGSIQKPQENLANIE
ncbi:CPBP family intramembrane metalloprotease [Tenacibaculum finnmarkense genomovar ulcerans]|uniref:CPBP family intramembrane glutamic endopeptidase n=1 Tax=Tenacibaculum finnmarkense TaxID=2781243 RepID=UPI00187B487F|nr:CPBP family intramembrane glutamic endopeptidase [Tenacibaculum finnmarkense]MBE7634938.1 CPBP family intramembrane metalloprotease [Tenacibaculum finnmarkense genomovar ulcerans]MCD8430445.1 CPBP family intramembrane metalloprotease [Tenacibaculum finnmarkense genomovar ulcerans]MCG8237056.1 CPBP family intramembrane metalloprotease [Tenacibaculum finnmarkense genomovar ulcerans]MCG8733347.1 CPBP family intramembrane metalloprotease [Tenacibaculum finnmarkense]MCG8807676.1 CPBP family intr